jgi:TonB family protein
MTFHRAALALLLISCLPPVSAQTATDQNKTDQNASDQKTTEPIQLPDSVAQGRLIRKVNPAYPPLARQARIQGTVVIGITITKTGDVENLQLESGHPMLAPAAVAAVRQWKYQPYLVNGDPVEVKTRVQVIFVLADSGINNATTPATDATGNRVRVSENIMRGLRIQEIDAAYPPLALKARIEGLVVLKEFVGKSGEVENLEIVSGDPLLAPAAIDAVKQWKYRPYVLNGEPLEVESLVRMNFTLLKKKEGSATDADLDALPKELVPEQTSPDETKSAAPSRIRVSSGVASQLLIRRVDPTYPPEARAKRIQGVVILQATIDPTGHVVELELISGDPLLAPAAIDAVRQWEYRPYLLNSQPLTVETKIQVNFTLED